MHPDLAEKFLERVRLRVAQGDTPTEPALSRENLEDLVLTMDAELTALRQRVVEVVGPFADEARHYDPPEGDDQERAWYNSHMTIGQLRAARALVNEMETTDGR